MLSGRSGRTRELYCIKMDVREVNYKLMNWNELWNGKDDEIVGTFSTNCAYRILSYVLPLLWVPVTSCCPRVIGYQCCDCNESIAVIFLSDA